MICLSLCTFSMLLAALHIDRIAGNIIAGVGDTSTSGTVGTSALSAVTGTSRLQTTPKLMLSVQSCKNILLSNPNAPSGVYQISTSNTQTVIEVYCEMGLNGGGYTFINPKYLPQLTNRDMQSWFTDTASFLMRVRSSDGTQPYSVLSQLSQYTGIPLKLGLSDTSSYATPMNAPILGSPYLYYGFLPVANATNNAVQGLVVNGNPLSFSNCDKNPNSFIALFANFRELTPSTYSVESTFCNSILQSGLANPSGRVMPADYFLFTEAHWGGCGGYTQTDARWKARGILGTAIGFR